MHTQCDARGLGSQARAAIERTGLIDRRKAVAGVLALSAAAALPRAASASTGRLIPVARTRLWVDDSGPADGPTIVYMHGGPGIGALEFETYMKPFLAARARLVSVDQRGVLRSDPIPEDAKVSVADIVSDFEVVRQTLGIPRWQVLGHSFGGMLALHYALSHPSRVTRVALENPAFDAAASGHWLAAAAAQALNGVSPAAAVEADGLADPATPVDPAFQDRLGKAMAALGSHRQDLYVAQSRNRDMFSRLAATAGLPDARWEQGRVPGMALLHSADFYEPMLPRLRELTMPILYVRGTGDHSTSPREIAGLLSAGARMETVPNAGHFVHVEEPRAMSELLLSS